MTLLLRSYLRLSFVLAFLLSAAPLLNAQSMMMRHISAPDFGTAINRGDFNGDGILDLVVANGDATTSISIFPGRADGTFGAPINTSVGHQPNDLAVGDFNNDGKLDLAVTDIDTNQVQVLLGNGNGTFQPPITIFTDARPASLTTSDFNHDGKMDLAVAVGVTSSSGVVVNEIEILEGSGNGFFSLANTIGLGGNGDFVRKVRVGDFNRDGNVDLAVMKQQQVSALFGNGNFTFDQVVLATYTTGTNDMNTGDLNQDSFTDILVSWFDAPGALTGGVDAFFGSSSRSMTRKEMIPATTSLESPGQITAADVNGDGIADIVGLDNDGTFADGLYVWLCNGEGSCNPSPTKFVYTTDRDKVALVAGDFNRDGKIDFAAAMPSSGRLEILLNATPRAACQKNVIAPAMTVCQPQDATFSNSPLHIVAEGDSSNPVTDINVYIDNVLKGQFAAASINQFFSLPLGNHFVVVKGFDSTGANFRSDRHVTIFSGAPGQTCATGDSVLAVTICKPAQNATLASPVQIFANSYSPRPLTAIQVYIDNQLDFNDSTSSEVNKLFSMGPGSHFITVKAWDATGNSVSQSFTINVQ